MSDTAADRLRAVVETADAIVVALEAADALAHDILTNDGWCYCGSNALRDGHDEGCKLDPALSALDAVRDALPPLESDR